MIKGFEEETAPLSQSEQQLLPCMVKSLATKRGKENEVTNKFIVEHFKNHGVKISEPRIRKIINYIRNNDLVPLLVAKNGGYYVATSEEEVKEYEHSLYQREMAIRDIRESIERQRRRIYG